ncbi:hypothetical protein FN3523_0429 [Francisella hispaniensis]|uniref:Uncharacterized protein n=2 Tax=Francisella hispaniensis TaxID=622488 RepID=F4BJE2_9GAMM|nr:hypothetical protein FN3523_0429 [Francisella hispaniensis]
MFSNNIAFISASNPLFGSAKFELRDPKNNEVLSTCDSSGECEIAKPINVQNTSSDYLVSKDILYMVKMLYQSKILISKIFKLS